VNELRGFPILIIDDSSDDLALTERALRACDVRNPILSFQKGADALDYLMVNFDVPVLIFLDMVMAPVSGTDVLAACERVGFTSRLPFVMLSGTADYKTLEAGYQLGARTFLRKPITEGDLQQVLKTLAGLTLQAGNDGYVIAREDKNGAEGRQFATFPPGRPTRGPHGST
jgi:two-component system response regulator